jgi:hypothetical protein
VSQKVRKKWVKEGWVSSGRALAWHAQGSRFHHQHHRKKKGSQEEREGKGRECGCLITGICISIQVHFLGLT